MLYLPPGKYPKGANLTVIFKDLFYEIELTDFIFTVGQVRFSTFAKSGYFLFSSQHQNNWGSKLVMIFSAVEASTIAGQYQTLDQYLFTDEVIEKLKQSQDKIKEVLKESVDSYHSAFGSGTSIFDFYDQYLDESQKKVIENSFFEIPYTKKKTGKIDVRKTSATQEFKLGTIFADYGEDSYNLEPQDPKKVPLKKILKRVLYQARNQFVHKAVYSPIFPDHTQAKIQMQPLFENGRLKSEFHSSLTFENFYNMTFSAFIKFWKDEYNQKK